METSSTEQLLILVEEETGREGVTLSTELDSLDMDSLDFLCLMRAVCDRIGNIPEVDWVKFETVGDIAKAITAS